VSSLPSDGFRLKLAIPDSVGLPPVGAHLYVDWSQLNPSEPPGWYLCTVSGYVDEGLAEITYRNRALETLDLRAVRWAFTQKNKKSFRPAGSSLPVYPLKKIRYQATLPRYVDSSEHKVKEFADDVAFISTNGKAHQSDLSAIDLKCAPLDLHFRPDKCASLMYKLGKVSNETFQIPGGFTISIAQEPGRYLGLVTGEPT